MDEDTIRKEGVKPLLQILHQVADMFPVKESAFRTRTLLQEKDSKDLTDTMIFLYNMGMSPMVSLGAGADDKDPDTVVVQASPPWRIGLPAKDYYTDANVVEKYTDTIAQIIENLHPDHKHENATLHAEWAGSKGHGKIAARGQSKEHAHDLVEFEKKLAAASPDAEDMSDVTVG
jgi:endothelin-converting enzyme